MASSPAPAPKRWTAAEFLAKENSIRGEAIKRKDEIARVAIHKFLHWLETVFALNFSLKMNAAIDDKEKIEIHGVRDLYLRSQVTFEFEYLERIELTEAKEFRHAEEIRTWIATFLKSFENDGWDIIIVAAGTRICVIMYPGPTEFHKTSGVIYASPSAREKDYVFR